MTNQRKWFAPETEIIVVVPKCKQASRWQQLLEFSATNFDIHNLIFIANLSMSSLFKSIKTGMARHQLFESWILVLGRSICRDLYSTVRLSKIIDGLLTLS